MSAKSTINTYTSLLTLARKLRSDLAGVELILLYAYNRTGKTRLSMEFKGEGKRKTKKNPTGSADTLYFNAYTEDLFTWDNDLENDSARGLRINQASRFFDGFKNEPLEPTIDQYLRRYADFDFDFTFEEVQQGNESFSRPVFVKFSKGDESQIKISRGEQNIFIWCVFMAICEQLLKYPEAYSAVKHVYIDDPISSLDDNNAIAVACDLAQLLRRTASRKDQNGAPAPIKVVFSSHHALFFNVMCNEIGRAKEGEPKVAHKRYFLHNPNGEGAYMLRATEDTPFFHHVASLAELQMAATLGTGKLYTFHFNALRSIMEKTASFFGHSDISFCLKALNNEDNLALYNRALNLLSHGKYAIHEPTEMGEDNKELFRRILEDFTTAFKFDLPDIVGAPMPAANPAASPAATS
ncbi:anticodon nuclease [Denitromonas sp.]|uniref:anticodon nuclease n=1 Tax=Denitromonas sp. TaxID=2734609 RepID=UPI003A8A96CB